jgi:hypothetical protein
MPSQPCACSVLVEGLNARMNSDYAQRLVQHSGEINFNIREFSSVELEYFGNHQHQAKLVCVSA